MRHRKNLPTLVLAFSLTVAVAAVPTLSLAQDAGGTVTGATVGGTDPDRPDPMDPQTRGLAVVADILLARPLGLVATLAGSALFLVALPFEAMSGDIGTPAELLMGQPARYTFTRPVGEIESLR